MHTRHLDYLATISSMVGRRPFYFSEVGPVLHTRFGVNGAIMKKLCDEKYVRKIRKKQIVKRNGQVLPCYQISDLGRQKVERVGGILAVGAA